MAEFIKRLLRHNGEDKDHEARIEKLRQRQQQKFQQWKPVMDEVRKVERQVQRKHAP